MVSYQKQTKAESCELYTPSPFDLRGTLKARRAMRVSRRRIVFLNNVTFGLYHCRLWLINVDVFSRSGYRTMARNSQTREFDGFGLSGHGEISVRIMLSSFAQFK